MKKIFLSVIFCLFYFSFASAATSKYEITIVKGELCAQGSSLVVTNCVNPVQVNDITSLTVDIASADAGQTAGTLGSLSKAKVGITYTHFRTTLSRLVTVNGSDGLCFTVSGQNGGLNAYAQLGTTANGDNRGDTTLSMPNTLGAMAATHGTEVIGSDSDGQVGLNAPGQIAAANTHFMHMTTLSKPFKIQAGKVPTLKIAFGTSTGTDHNTGVNANCLAAATGCIGPIDVTMTID
tara:strand:+ start:71 stop:778 length:708 start_codon:yes stop_codon:yes gene_type:complete